MNILLSLPADFSFRETLSAHGWRQLLPFAYDAETATLERTERLTNGRVLVLRLREADADTLDVAVSLDANTEDANTEDANTEDASTEDANTEKANSEEVDPAEIVTRVRRMLQLDVPLAPFHVYCAAHRELAHIPARKQGRLLCCPTLWEDVVKVICTTNTTWTQTRAMVRRIVTHFGSPRREDPAVRAFPTPDQIAAVPYETFAAQARLGYRNAAVHGLAVAIRENRLDLEALRDPYSASLALWKKLQALRGVGPYAASCLMITLGRYERVNVDSWARMMVGRELGRPVTDKEVHAFFAPYEPWQGLVYHFYPWKPGEEELP